MDEVQKIDSALVKKLFDQGLMGIEMPEEFGGVGASFFSSILTIQEISAVDLRSE
ncbi:acyl-CoA dehydrogenase family protein [Tunturiibacter empetritectus]|uniref:Alkylation response protein AidB-like acyl-CoA dehydrogenase n=2 Tax=Tunturiibacter TaxID=3154218 RepID=A0A852VHJ5_9BACT|nr:acyl-CoA dehydrogenase family protein [Edaphobacter lichenicola]NYF92263.1 alkylation response protein AidB-like acyl-CoA dehydrogenase [Edaphobacter lichenicola]